MKSLQHRGHIYSLNALRSIPISDLLRIMMEAEPLPYTLCEEGIQVVNRSLVVTMDVTLLTATAKSEGKNIELNDPSNSPAFEKFLNNNGDLDFNYLKRCGRLYKDYPNAFSTSQEGLHQPSTLLTYSPTFQKRQARFIQRPLAKV